MGRDEAMQILYATDGSEGALAAAGLLAHLPLEPHSTVTVLTVVDERDRDGADRILAAAAETLRDGTNAEIRTKTRNGKPGEEVLRESEEQPTDLIVLGSRGLGAVARFFLGSVADQVARHAACPVLVARPLQGELRAVVLGIDGSTGAAHAAEWLKRFPLPPDCVVHLATALPHYQIGGMATGSVPRLAAELRALQSMQEEEARTRLQEVAAAFQEAGRRAVPEFRQSHPAEGLIAVAEAQNAGMIVVGRQGLSRVERFFMGSVSENVLRHAPCSVLVVPETRG